jgi:hypothetical protein
VLLLWWGDLWVCVRLGDASAGTCKPTHWAVQGAVGLGWCALKPNGLLSIPGAFTAPPPPPPRPSLGTTGAQVQTTVNGLQTSALGTCDKFEERQVGAERYNLFTGVCSPVPPGG